MCRVILLLFIIYIAGSHAQQSVGGKTAYIDSLLELSYQSYAQMDINSSIKGAKEALLLSNEVNYSKGKARGNFYIAQALFSLGEYGRAIEYLQLAEIESHVKDDLILSSEICRVKGRSYGSLQLYDPSIREFQKGLGYINQIKNDFEREYLTSLAFDNLAHSYSLQNMTDSVLHYLNRNKELLENTSEDQFFRSRINLYAQLGKAHTKQEEYDVATKYFTDALHLAEINNFPYTSWIYLQWGNMKSQQNLLDSAIIKYRAGLKNLEQTNLRAELPGMYTALRDVYVQKGNKDSALVYHQKKIAIEEELTEANIKALDMAVQILLDEEKRQLVSQSSKARSMALAIIVLIGIIFIVAWVRWRRRYERVERKKQKLQEAIEEKRDSVLDEVVSLARQNDASFLPRFMELFPLFTKRIYQRHPDLSQSSFQFCTYIFLHFSSKEIAEFMFIEHKSVQTRKNRLRKQLNLPKNTDLYLYMRWLNEPEDESSVPPAEGPDFF